MSMSDPQPSQVIDVQEVIRDSAQNIGLPSLLDGTRTRQVRDLVLNSGHGNGIRERALLEVVLTGYSAENMRAVATALRESADKLEKAEERLGQRVDALATKMQQMNDSNGTLQTWFLVAAVISAVSAGISAWIASTASPKPPVVNVTVPAPVVNVATPPPAAPMPVPHPVLKAPRK